MKLDSLEKLYVQELKDLYSAENQLVEALPNMMRAAGDTKLKDAFRTHLQETKNHVTRLEQIFSQLDYEPTGHKCLAMEGLVKEGEELMKSDISPEVLDAGLVGAAQRVEHYEIAAYGTARAYAEMLNDQQAADLLLETLDEERHANQLLTELAESSLNSLAMAK